MARGMGRPFQRGTSGDSRRSPGLKNVLARVREVVNEVHKDNLPAIKAALARVATSPRTALQFQELRARLNKEIGVGAGEAAGGRVTVVFQTNVRPEKLAAARIRALPLPNDQAEDSSLGSGA